LKKYTIILLLAIAGLTNRASAYTLITSSTGQVPTWTAMPVKFWINQNGSPQIANGSELEAVKSAFQTWQNVSIASVSFQYMGTTAVPTVGEDGMNVITFVDDSVPLGSETIASTFSFFNVNGAGILVMQEADIALSTSSNFSTSGEAGKYDIQSVVTHEAGHLLGLDHSALLSSVMTPFGTAGQLDQRTLSYDDMAGVALLYPNTATTASLGGISGTITASGTPVFGAHVVALDSNGSDVASTISNPDGTYEIDFLPAGAYRLYAEPLKGPVTEQNIGGTSTSFYTGLNTSFSTTYSGDVANLALASSRQITAARLTSGVTIHVLGAGSLNLTEPASYATHIAQGTSGLLTVGGANLGAGDAFSASNSNVTLGTPSYGGTLAPDAPTSAQLPLTVAAGAATGPKSIAVTASGVTSVLSGVLIVTNPQPANIQVAPTTGTVDGGTAVSITGQNFRRGAQVFFGGLAAAGVQVVSATTIQAIVPANSAGAANAVVINSDGTWGVQSGAFTYSAVPPQISSAAPLSGPPATIVTILGSEFSSRISDINVQFNATSANIVSATRTRIDVLVPYGSTSGPITVSVAGRTASGPAFTVTAPAASTNLAIAAAQFIDATSGGTALTFGDPDDAAALVSLPFTFTLFNKSYASGTQIAVATNGWISLDATTTPQYQNAPLPGAGTNPPALLAPFFDDLILKAGSSILLRTSGTAPNRQFVIEWSNLAILDEQGADTGAAITFEAVLYEGSNDIQFMYKSLSGPRSDGSSATVGIQDSARSKGIQSGYNQSILASGLALTYHFINGVYGPPAAPTSKTYSIPNLGGMSVITDGLGSNLTAGYATIQPDPGNTTPAGVAIFGYRPNGVLVTEAGVPASPLIRSGRIYAEVAGPVNTGLAMANPNPLTATVSFYFTDSTGATSHSGTTTLPPNGKIAAFLDQVPFSGGSNLQGTFTFSSDQPVAAIALRGLTNERNEFLISTLPVIDMSAAAGTATAVLPDFADGGGWRTQIILINPTASAMSGTIGFISPAGTATGTPVQFSIPPGSSFKQVTAGTAAAVQGGSVQIVPAAGSATPASVAIFSYRPAGFTVSEAAVMPSAGTALRMYVEASGIPATIGSIQSGVAVTNLDSATASVTFDLTDLTGKSLGSTSFSLPGNGQMAKFLNEIFPSLALPPKGILRVSTSGSNIAGVGLRERYNERNDFLITTTPPTNEKATASLAPLLFPHIVNGGGYTTQFILFSGTTSQSVTGSIHFVNQDATPLGLNVN
jgi:hypothetical protein